MVKLRIQGDTEEEVTQARERLLKLLPGCTFAKPREGINPRYEGRQKWACYGEWHMPPVRARRKKVLL